MRTGLSCVTARRKVEQMIRKPFYICVSRSLFHGKKYTQLASSLMTGVTQLRNDSNKLQMISSRKDKAALYAVWFD